MTKQLHELSDKYCPFCLDPLTKAKSTGWLFCQGSHSGGYCEYEAPGGVNDHFPPLCQADMLSKKIEMARSRWDTAKKNLTDARNHYHKLIAEQQRRKATTEPHLTPRGG